MFTNSDQEVANLVQTNLSLSLYTSQLKHTLMSAMMSNKSCQRIKLNILLKTRVI